MCKRVAQAEALKKLQEKYAKQEDKPTDGVTDRSERR